MLFVSYNICMVSTLTQDSCVTNSHYNEQNLCSVVGNLFFAGTDTTSTTIRWALLFMAKYPQIQGKKDIHSIAFKKKNCFIVF